MDPDCQHQQAGQLVNYFFRLANSQQQLAFNDLFGSGYTEGTAAPCDRTASALRYNKTVVSNSAYPTPPSLRTWK
jgi:hypothetical protein